MNSRSQSTVASMLLVVLGAFLMFSPLWITMTGGALISTLIVGGVITIAALVQLLWSSTVPSWISGLAAVWLLGSAFIFDMSSAAFWSTVISAAIGLIIAAWDGVEINHLHRDTQVRI